MTKEPGFIQDALAHGPAHRADELRGLQHDMGQVDVLSGLTLRIGEEVIVQRWVKAQYAAGIAPLGGLPLSQDYAIGRMGIVHHAEGLGPGKMGIIAVDRHFGQVRGNEPGGPFIGLDNGGIVVTAAHKSSMCKKSRL